MNPVEAAKEQVRKDLCKGGVLDNRLEGYEERAQQIQMAEKVAAAIETGSHTVIEAATGTGKSLAYLLPLARTDKIAIIATANKALQEQLFYKDIPFVQKHVRQISAALVKGMGNYICLQHFEEERAGFQGLIKDKSFDELSDYMQDTEDFDGDLDMIPFSVTPSLRSRIAADSDDCAWRSCPFYEDCYVHTMREKAAKAQVLVVNHTLLLLDTEMEGWLLPQRDIVIIDEAHHLEDEATRAFTVTVSSRSIDLLLAQKRLRAHCDNEPMDRAMRMNSEIWARLEESIKFGARTKVTLTNKYEEGLLLASAIADIGSSFRRNRPEMMDEREEQLFDKLQRRIAATVADLRLVFNGANSQNLVFYAGKEKTKRGNSAIISVSAAPIDVTELLRKNLFDKVSVIATSATLSVNNSFEFFNSRVGLDEAETLILDPVFDYYHHALLYVPRMRFEPAYGPEGVKYLDELAEQMDMLVRASSGRAFLLFTSMRALESVLDRLQESLENDQFTVLAQGFDINRSELVRRFRSSDKAVLFGLRSFWEGIDIAGDALSLVAIDKLPFDPPDDPVHEARVNFMREKGLNWFGGYTLPQAILRLKQGVGRLLRTKDDRGALAILDTRLLTKSYGKNVIFSLPPARRTVKIDEVRNFFGGETSS